MGSRSRSLALPRKRFQSSLPGKGELSRGFDTFQFHIGLAIVTSSFGQDKPAAPAAPAPAAPRPAALDFTMKNIDGKDVDLAKTYSGKVLKYADKAASQMLNVNLDVGAGAPTE